MTAETILASIVRELERQDDAAVVGTHAWTSEGEGIDLTALAAAIARDLALKPPEE